MNIRELKNKIKDLPDHMEVMIEEIETEYGLGLLNEVEVKKVKFYGTDDEDLNDLPEEECLVLTAN